MWLLCNCETIVEVSAVLLSSHSPFTWSSQWEALISSRAGTILHQEDGVSFCPDRSRAAISLWESPNRSPTSAKHVQGSCYLLSPLPAASLRALIWPVSYQTEAACHLEHIRSCPNLNQSQSVGCLFLNEFKLVLVAAGLLCSLGAL